MSWDSKRENGATKWELKIAWTAILVDEGSLRREHQEGASEVGESPYLFQIIIFPSENWGFFFWSADELGLEESERSDLMGAQICRIANLVNEGGLRNERQEVANEVGESPYRSRCLRLDICSINNYTWFH